jgi:CxxC motif-containing protein (DUF1111 family)
MATAFGATNSVPSFITLHGPIREVRFKSDGQVHPLYVISGRSDIPRTAPPCRLDQEDFDTELRRQNLSFRIPTPLFGAGRVEAIPDAALRANRQAQEERKARLGIDGKLSMVQGRVGRFGWKAQHFNLTDFAGEAYNVEMGITNEVSGVELEQHCQYAEAPNSPKTGSEPSDVELFVEFMRALPPPASSSEEDTESDDGRDSDARRDTENLSGRRLFDALGCQLCHTPQLAGVPLFSDLLVHNMGRGLADGVSQGNAGPQEFRTAPLWGVGQRLFFLHDGRTQDLQEAVEAHASPESEATAVIERFLALPRRAQQALLDFLRSL